MSITVKTLRVESIEVTSANEKEVLQAEWDRRYADRPFVEGDHVVFIRDGRQRHVDAFGEGHAGKRGIVTALSDNGEDVKVLAITNTGKFDEFWSPENCLEAVEGY